MRTFFFIQCLVVLAFVAAVAHGQGQQQEEVSDKCLGCICEASTGCKKDIGCTGAGVCGPMLISWPFWADGGKYVVGNTDPSDKNAYSQCANDLYCAGATVRGYVAKYRKDCNGDGKIDCEDFARLHKMGFGGCSSPAFTESEYYRKFAACVAAVQP